MKKPHNTVEAAIADGWIKPYAGNYGRIYGRKRGNHRVFRCYEQGAPIENATAVPCGHCGGEGRAIFQNGLWSCPVCFYGVGSDAPQHNKQALENATAVKFIAREWIVLWNVGVTPYMSSAPVEFEGREFTRLNQVTTLADLEALSADFNAAGKPALMDEEHFHRLPNGKSSALGWITETKVEGTQLFGRVDWTTDGLEMIESGKLRYVSPVLNCMPRSNEELEKEIPEVYPVELLNAGLTNTPRNTTLPPISDPVNGAKIFLNRNEFTTAAPAANPNQKTNDNTAMDKQLLAALGLSETATIEEALAAIKALQDAGLAAAEEAAVQTVNAFKGVIPAGKEDFYKGLLISNRETAMVILEDLKATAATVPAVIENKATVQPVFNRQVGTVPAIAGKTAVTKEEKDRTPQEHAAVFGSMPAGAERTAYYNTHKNAIKRGQQPIA